ncbi:hypothetical protein [Alkalithermobacter paradoxus]|uniref:DUF4007 domain-containing protein n=1 Tax=Alkalithermobacter paradoxus TaxID=29349 RepID=A0A1V4I6Q1_9FIRM|nr:hypothetical protein CLOTH_14100 [[Clostridium] thermoalcaliphilum]
MSNTTKGNLNFHESFCLELEYIGKILQIADNYGYLTKEEVSELTGIPTGDKSGKVEPHIYYANYMNLIDVNKDGGKYLLKKTDLGNLIYNEDLFLVENVSKAMCNYFLNSERFGATMWFQIFRIITDKYGDVINEEVLINELKDMNGIKINLTPFRSTYRNDNSLKSLHLLEIIDEDARKVKFNKNNINKDLMYVYSYTLLKELEALDVNRQEFTVSEIIEDIKWHRGFCWDEEVAMNVLDELSDMRILSLNKQLIPVTVIKNINSEDLLDKVYSLLS